MNSFYVNKRNVKRARAHSQKVNGFKRNRYEERERKKNKIKKILCET